MVIRIPKQVNTGARMETIRRGSKGPVVQAWGEFLRGQGFLLEPADGNFNVAIEAASKAYQRSRGLPTDGVVGHRTWGQAMADGFELFSDTDTSKLGPNWPPQPVDLTPAGAASRAQLFGSFASKPAPTTNNPEGITILGNWVANNITTVSIPQLVGVPGAHPKGLVQIHVKAAPQLTALFCAWEQAGLLHLIKSWGGSWVPRFVRGSRTNLSNHSFGSAFDINAKWNGLRCTPALVGHAGSVRELVPLASQLGWFWGGHYDRKDGMHFEISRLLTESLV